MSSGCANILGYRPKATFIDLNSYLSNSYISNKADELSAIYIPLEDFDRFHFRKKESAGIFLFDNDSPLPCYFATATLCPLNAEFKELNSIFIFKCSPTPISLCNGNIIFVPHSRDNIGLADRDFTATIIPLSLWINSPFYFDRILLSCPRRSSLSILDDVMPDDRSMILLREKIKSLLLCHDSPPFYLNQELQILHHLKIYRVEILATSKLKQNTSSIIDNFSYSSQLERWMTLLLDFVNRNSCLFFISSPSSIIVFERHEANYKQNSLYYLGNPTIATGISFDHFQSMFDTIKRTLEMKDCSNTFSHKYTFGKKLFLIEGHPASGKSLIVRNLTKCIPIPFIAYIDCFNWISRDDIDDAKKTITTALHESIANRPSIIRIFNFSSKLHPTIWTCIKELLFERAEQIPNIVILLAGGFSDFELLYTQVPHNFGHDPLSCYQIPSFSQRLAICEHLLGTYYSMHKKEYSPLIAEKTHGYLYEDLCKVIELAFGNPCPDAYADPVSFLSDKLGITSISPNSDYSLKRVLDALKLILPSFSHEWSVRVPHVGWDEVGGKDAVKQLMKEAVEWPIKYPERFSRFGINPPKGILLYGPPGNSKTFLAKALATECKLNFIAIKGPQLLNKWVGESEKSLKKVFRLAREHAPTILFFDEIDAIGGARGADGSTSSSGIGDRLLTQLLVELDGFAPLENVIFIAATNRPDILDPALVRPGRIDKHIFVDLPNYDERLLILKIQAKKMPFEDETACEEIAVKTEGYSAAELVAICQRAGILELETNINCDKLSKKKLLEALKLVPPLTNPKLVEFYKNFRFGV